MHYSHEAFLKELGARLKQMRTERGWTLRHMVVDHGFHITHWQSFEKGRGISVPSLLRICDAFDISLEDLVRGLGLSTTQLERHPIKTEPPKSAARKGKTKP